MLNSISTKLVKKELVKNVSDLLPDLGLKNGKVKNDEIRFNARGSLSVSISGNFSGCWHHFELGEGGDVLDLIKWSQDVEFFEAKHWAFNWLLCRGVSPEDLLYG